MSYSLQSNSSKLRMFSIRIQFNLSSRTETVIWTVFERLENADLGIYHKTSQQKFQYFGCAASTTHLYN